MRVRNYMKKPIIIEAMVFENTVECLHKLSEFMYGKGKEAKINYCDKESPKLIIDTLEGTMYASEGDYIIKGISGEFYPCKPDIFHKTYEEV
nr:MAG TPA: PGDYG protein [Bacteriophage sp.]